MLIFRICFVFFLTFMYAINEDAYQRTGKNKHQIVAWFDAVASGVLLYAIFDNL